MNVLSWPDVVIAVALAVAAFRGYRRGFINELTGAIAIAFALAAALHYPGMWDEFLGSRLHVSYGARHVVGMFAYAALAYAVVLALGTVLARVTKLPFVGIANAILGAIVGAAKITVFLWALLYVALFFPLPGDVRRDLHAAPLVGILELPNDRVDDSLRASLPPVVVPFAQYLFSQHRV